MAPSVLPALCSATHSDEHAAFRDSVRRFLASEVAPNLDSWREAGAVPGHVFAVAGVNGFLGTTAPESFGGGGSADPAFLVALIDETVSCGVTGLALLWALHAGAAISALTELASPEQRQRWLPGLVSGETVAIPHPDVPIRGLPGGQVADLLLVGRGEDAAVLDIGSAFSTVRTGRRYLAMPESGFADIEVATDALDSADRIESGWSGIGRDVNLWLAVVAISTARRSVDLAIRYAEDRQVFGRPLADLENTRFALADIASTISAATSLGDRCLAERAVGSLDDARAASFLRVALATAEAAADQALQFHGGYGYMREYPIAQLFADTRYLRVLADRYGQPRSLISSALFRP